MNKKTKHYEFEKPKGFFIFNINSNGLFDTENPDDEYFSADMRILFDIGISEKLENNFQKTLLDFVKKYNSVFKKLKNKYFTISVYVSIKPSGTYVSYTPIHEEKYPKKQYKEFYGSFKIDKVDMLKFLNKYSKKIKLEINYF